MFCKANQSFVNMDECISNLVVTTENYVVQPVENIPISMVEGYENVEIAHLVSTGHHNHVGPVIRLTTANPPLKPAELHPLEAEIQRDFELNLKQLKQQQHHQQQQQQTQQHNISRQHNTSVIHSVSDSALQAVVRRTNQFIPVQQKPLEIAHESQSVFEEVMQIQHIVPSNKESAVQKTNNIKPENITLPHLYHAGRQMVLQGKQYIILPENSSLLNTDWKNSKQTEILKDVGQPQDIGEVSEISQIPLTVQNYNSVGTISDPIKSSKSGQESDSEDESEEIEPVFDYEPDPESTSMENIEDANKPNKCYMCFKSFRQKKNMYAHIRKIHSTQPKIEGGILCPLCKMHALRQEHLRNHLETLHDVHIEKEEKLFNTFDEFLTWKEHIERETLSLYVSKSSAKLLANNQQKTYYKCHRSGNYVSVKKENRKKRLKVQGSNKIGATCPAAMEVTENVHGVNVCFWKTHVGHDNDLAHLVLSKEDRARIIECLNSDVPWDKVLEKIKREAEKTPNVPSRLTMVSKQDLRNMKKIHDMKTCPDLFPARKKVHQGRKPMKERMLKRASQSLIIEKADLLLNILETTDVIPEFRPKVCLMIDNLISTVKRRAVKNVHRRENIHSKRRKELLKSKAIQEDNVDIQINGESTVEWDDMLFKKEKNGNDESSNDSKSDIEKSVATQTIDSQSNLTSVIKSPRKRGRPKKFSTESPQKRKAKTAEKKG